MRPIIVTEKHIVQHSIFTVAAGAITKKNIAICVAVAAKDSPGEVDIGSRISAIYVEMWINSNAAAIGSCNITLEKLVAGGTAMTFTQSNNLSTYPNKKNIFYTTQGLSPSESGNPRLGIGGWFKIPKGKQRMGLGDIFAVNISAITGGIEACGFEIFKEQK